MKITRFQFHKIVYLLLLVSNTQIAKTSVRAATSIVDAGSKHLDYIKTCRWKNAATSCVVFAFYDNCPSHKKIAELFDSYNFKSTFFVISEGMLVDSLKTMVQNGHEIGNHTCSHPHLASLDSMQIEREIKDAKEKIENTFGINCMSFSEPFASRSPLSLKIALNYHSFIRAYKKYPENEHINYTITPSASMVELKSNLKNSLMSGSLLEIEGHGMDGDGYEPITKQLLTAFLVTLQTYVYKEMMWITTYSQAGSYENLYHEIKLNCHQKGDTVIVKFDNFIPENYNNPSPAIISIEIPTILSSELQMISQDVELTQKKDKFVATLDLKKQTEISFVLKGLSYRFNTPQNILMTTNFVYPNPVNEQLNIRTVGKVKRIQVFTYAGKLIIDLPYNTNKINVSHLPKGLYFIRVLSSNGEINIEYKNKFLKK